MRRRRLAALVVLAVLAGIGWLAWVELGGEEGSGQARPAAASPGEATDQEEHESQPSQLERERVKAGLGRGVSAATALGGRAEAAAMLDGWREPVTVSAGPAGRRWMRMWSLSKVATAIALLRELGWGERPGEPVSPEVAKALEGAIVRSENCRQRRVVLDLQRVAMGPAAARSAVAAALQTAGAEGRIGTQIEPPEAICLPYLEPLSEIDDPLAPALLLGTSTWGAEDAVRLVQALGEEAYGAAISDRVLRLMRMPKRASREVIEGELTAPLDWGAGRAFDGLSPAYKAGWGGVLDGEFMASQIVLVTMPGGERLAVAAMFHPQVQPIRDDPGITPAPAAIEAIMRALREALAP